MGGETFAAFLVAALGVAADHAQAQTLAAIPKGDFEPHLAGRTRLEIFTPNQRAIERTDPSGQLACPDGQTGLERIAFDVPQTSYRLELLRCGTDPPALEYAAQGLRSAALRIVRTSGTKKDAWGLGLGASPLSLGIDTKTAMLVTQVETEKTGSAAPAVSTQPPILATSVTGVVVVQTLSAMMNMRGAISVDLDQLLLDLRGDAPHQLAHGSASRSWNGLCGDDGPDGSTYSCRWDPGAADILCVDRQRSMQRTLALSTGSSLPQSLGPTVPIERSDRGDLIYLRGSGLMRVVAVLAENRRVALGGVAGIVEKDSGEWRFTPATPPSLWEGYEWSNAEPVRVTELRPDGQDRFFDVVQGGAQHLIRTRLSLPRYAAAIPIADVSANIDYGGACARSGASEILAAQWSSKGVRALSETLPPWEDGVRTCPVAVDIPWDQDPRVSQMPTDDEPQPLACDRPMSPLLSRVKSGRPDLLWADPVDRGFSLRGRSTGTIVLLESGLSDADWERIALVLPLDVEVLRFSARTKPFSIAGELPGLGTALNAISSKRWAVVSFGVGPELNLQSFASMTIRPLATERVDGGGAKALEDAILALSNTLKFRSSTVSAR